MQEMSTFAKTILDQKYLIRPGETWEEISDRVAYNVIYHGAQERYVDNSLEEEYIILKNLIQTKKFMPAGRYFYAAGRPLHQTQNCALYRVKDSREGWAEHLYKSTMALMTGAGIGANYSEVREEGAIIHKTGGFATGPISLMKMTNEAGRGIMQGGARRSAIWAGLIWSHPDIFKFIHVKDWPDHIREAKKRDFNAYAPMDGTNISVALEDLFFVAIYDHEHPFHDWAKRAYWEAIHQMLSTGEPGFSIDVGFNVKETLRNACTEACSEDDSDICNLGSINMANIESLEEMAFVVKHATRFLYAGTFYSDLPHKEIQETRSKNRRLGLGMMGLHEFLLKNKQPYAVTGQLKPYLEIYAEDSRKAADELADYWGEQRSIKIRAIAPTGTIAIVAETTTGIEPIFCVAYKRRYLKGTTWMYQNIVDPTAKRLIEQGFCRPDEIEDAYSLANDVEKRVAFQADMQQYVDQAISSTINLPAWGTELNCESKVPEFGAMLLKYLPRLRGITVYPDGARDGQPLTPITYAEAMNNLDQVFVEATDVCDITKGGTCAN